MQAKLSRRTFVKDVAVAAVAAGTSSIGSVRAGAAAARIPCGCRDGHLSLAGKPDAWANMKALGAECIESVVEMNMVCPNLTYAGGKHTLDTEDNVRRLKDDLAASGCRITAFAMGNRFDERLEAELEWARKLVKAADRLGVDAIRIDVWPRKLSQEEFLPFAIKTCKALCEMTEGTRVKFGIENHGKTTNNPEFLDKVFEGVGSPRLGLTLDVGNFYWYGHPLNQLYPIYEKYAGRVFHTHCKNIRYPDEKQNAPREMGWGYDKYCCPIYDGDISYERLIGILHKAHYQGGLCIENESLSRFPESERAGIVQKEIELLKKLRDAG